MIGIGYLVSFGMIDTYQTAALIARHHPFFLPGYISYMTSINQCMQFGHLGALLIECFINANRNRETHLYIPFQTRIYLPFIFIPTFAKKSNAFF